MIAYFVYIIPNDSTPIIEQCADEESFLRRLVEVETLLDCTPHDIRWQGTDTVPPMRILAASETEDILPKVDHIVGVCSLWLRQN